MTDPATHVDDGEIITVNPATGRPSNRYPTMSDGAIGACVDRSSRALSDWSRTSLTSRIALLDRLAATLEQRRDDLARLVIDEVGKPLREALGEIDKCALTCRYYAETSADIFAAREVEGPGVRNEIRYEPLGVVLAVMPWNFPLWQVIRCAVPALTVGNTVVLKHSPNTTGTALAAAEVFAAAGYPIDVFQTIVVDEARVGEVVTGLVERPEIAAVTLTGSSRAGSAVAAAAGRAMKKTVLELGGSDPFVVLDDADLDRTVAAAVASRFVNCGQSCLAAKRLILHRSIAAEFTDRFVAATNALVVGDPHDPATQIGPMARSDLREALVAQLTNATDSGARIVAGGHILDQPGWWFAPTVLIDVTEDMRVMAEEVFGPIAPITVVDDDAAAITLANLTDFGLGASVWSADEDRANTVGSQIHSGALFLNAMVASDPRLPFGGIGLSGYGRELGVDGAREFANTRTVVHGGR